MAIVGFAGSRSLASRFSTLVSACVRSVLASGRTVASGCAAGADAYALSAVPASSASSLSVFAVGTSAGRGFPGATVPDAVLRARCAGASVLWLAGGGLRLFGLRDRLLARSRALVSFVASGGAGSALVCFVSGGLSSSPGTWYTVRLALDAGLPVVVFPCGCSESCFPDSLPTVGSVSFAPAGGSGCWSGGFRAAASQPSLA